MVNRRYWNGHYRWDLKGVLGNLVRYLVKPNIGIQYMPFYADLSDQISCYMEIDGRLIYFVVLFLSITFQSYLEELFIKPKQVGQD